MTDRRTFYNQRAPYRLRENKRGYHDLLRKYYRFIIPPGRKVLEVGCGLGDLLASVEPAEGLGLDFSEEMVRLARQRHPALRFEMADAARIPHGEKFDYLIASDLINDLEDVQNLFEQLRSVATEDTRFVMNFFNNFWRPILGAAEAAGAKSPTLPQNWLSTADVSNMLHLAGWESVRTETRVLWPIRTPLVGPFFNRMMAPLLKHFCLTIFMIARPRPTLDPSRQLTCSIVIPARNEEGNIEDAVRRIPKFGKSMEIIFVEGHSSDRTWPEIQRVKGEHPDRNILALQQTGKGKGNAVREGFAAASGELLFILDADLTVPPEELPKFYEAARSGAAEFVNGVRLVYPMENEAMRFMNMLGNKFFSMAFSWLLGQSLKDTLCGTKVLARRHYDSIARNRAYFGDFDPFGDFDLLFGAAKLNLRILDLPIRYHARTYGETNISRWRHGFLLLRMVRFAAMRLKFF